MTLVDTSSWVEALRRDGREEVRARVEALLMQGDAVACDMVWLELWAGARGGTEKRRLAEMERVIPCLPTTEGVWQKARELARACRSAGSTVPATDLLVAACACVHGADLEHCDEHFGLILEAAP